MTEFEQGMLTLRACMETYHPLEESTWQALKPLCHLKHIHSGSELYGAGKHPDTFAFVLKGLFRVFISDENGNEYNKNFFDEHQFPGSMAALLTNTPSEFTLEALEESDIIESEFNRFRQLLNTSHDLALFQIHYLERNWLLAKEPREVAFVQADAAHRYQQFKAEFPNLIDRIPQYHIASHLGITPTQLSRIRKKAQNQPM